MKTTVHIEEMTALLERWVNINSYSKNLEGIDLLIKEVQSAFKRLKADEEKIFTFSKSRALFFKKRAKAPIQIYLGGHLDTVFPPEYPFQKATYINDRTLQGPGVTDMKGGIVVLLKALEAFEKKESASRVGWEIFLNSDEELGSPFSTPFIEECSHRVHFALLFEPTLPDGFFASKRKGSSNYMISSKGKKAHAGREPQKGKNAIYPLAHFVSKIAELNQPDQGTLVNVGVIEGGIASNIIPDHAECHLNIRTDQLETMLQIENKMNSLAQQYGLQCIKQSHRPPKPFDTKTQELFTLLKKCGSQLKMKIEWRETGGVCDGNTFAKANVPTIDSMGVRGGNIHTENELIHLDSLSEKTQLAELLLTEIASGKLQ